MVRFFVAKFTLSEVEGLLRMTPLKSKATNYCKTNNAVCGVIEAVGEIGGNVGMAARAAVEGALEAAGSINGAMVKTMKEILVGAAADEKAVVRAVLPQSLQVKGVRQGLSLVQ